MEKFKLNKNVSSTTDDIDPDDVLAVKQGLKKNGLLQRTGMGND